jgi:hypothetical protein
LPRQRRIGGEATASRDAHGGNVCIAPQHNSLIIGDLKGATALLQCNNRIFLIGTQFFA